MKTKKQIALLLTFSLSSLFLFSQEKTNASTTTKAKEIDKNFKLEPLPAEESTNAKFKENYDQGVAYYNKAVSIIKSSNNSTNIGTLDSALAVVQAQLKQALPYFEKAYQLNSKDKNTLSALMGIYFSLSDKDKYEKYKKEFGLLNDK